MIDKTKGKIGVVSLVCGMTMMLFAALLAPKCPIYGILALPGLALIIVGLIFYPYFIVPETVVVKEE